MTYQGFLGQRRERARDARDFAPEAYPGCVNQDSRAIGACSTQRDVSERTGEPVRGSVTWLASAVLWVAALLMVASFVQALWRLKDSLVGAARLVDMLAPKPASLLAVMCPFLLAVLALIPMVLAGIAAFQGWNGHSFAPYLAIAAAFTASLGWFLTPIALAAIPVAMIGALLLFLPPQRRYVSQQAMRRVSADEPAECFEWPQHLHYGPLPRYR